MTRVVLLIVLCAVAAGCATPGTDTRAAAADTVSGGLPDGTGWWFARFRIAEPDITAPRWHLDALLAGEVIAPVLERQHGDILIWRVHRRSADDAHGHVFSFIFYATADGAERVYAALANQPVLQGLRRAGTVTDVILDDLRIIARPGIGDTSDPDWPEVVQQTWPAYAMGASRMWLDLVGLIAEAHAGEPDLDLRYRAVQEAISDTWSGYGQHAMLHHLSALFGYQPLLVTY
jgi:hypothetical protein